MSRFQRIDWQQKSHSFFFRQVQDLTRQIELVGFDPAAPDRNALRFPKRVRHRAADQNGVGLFHQRLDHADLIRNLRAAEDDHERLRRFGQLVGKILDFLLHQETHGGLLHELRDAGGAGVRAMRRAESIVHVKVAEFRQRFRKRGIVRFFARMEPDVLEQRDVAFLHVSDDLFRDFPDRVVTETRPDD